MSDEMKAAVLSAGSAVVAAVIGACTLLGVSRIEVRAKEIETQSIRQTTILETEMDVYRTKLELFSNVQEPLFDIFHCLDSEEKWQSTTKDDLEHLLNYHRQASNLNASRILLLYGPEVSSRFEQELGACVDFFILDAIASKNTDETQLKFFQGADDSIRALAEGHDWWLKKLAMAERQLAHINGQAQISILPVSDRNYESEDWWLKSIERAEQYGIGNKVEHVF